MGVDLLTGLQDLASLAGRFSPSTPDGKSTPDTLRAAVWIDVDGLIWFNDTEGHEAGDAALAAIGRWLLATCAACDLEGFRIAGDEFVLLRPASASPLSPADAAAIADRLVAESPSLALRFTGRRYAANNRDLLTVSAVVFRADHRLALDRRAVCHELAEAVYAAGLAAGTRYQRRASLLDR